MPSTPRFKRQRDPRTPKSQKMRLPKGRYSDGNWWCNCEPRQKATLREVKKTGPNNGKLYWKCDDCNFFIWRDEAQMRETGLRTPEKAMNLPVTPSRRQSDEDSVYSAESVEDSSPDTPMPKSARNRTQASSPPKSSAVPSVIVETPSRGPAKRRRGIFEEDEGEFSDLGSDEERQMADIADKSAEKAAQQRYTTPSASRSTDAISGLPTPSVSRTLFPTSESKRQKQVSFDETPSRHTGTMSSATVSANTTPSKTPSRQQGLTPSSPFETDYDVTDEVMGLLRGKKVDSKTLSSVQNILTTAARRTRGIMLGRDTARASLKAKDEKIATLQERIVELENREKMHRKQMTDIKANLMKMYDDN
ncbi:hypothetical protein NXS19_012203 [Fusarium pseudograminearum]|nr:hypothetical protein NXS19_012203 [Fusarium pseudograminearum]